MNKIKIVLMSIAILTVFTACSNKEASKKDVKVVAAPKQTSVEQKKEDVKKDEVEDKVATKKVEDSKNQIKQENNQNKNKSSEEIKTDDMKAQNKSVQAKESSTASKSSKQSIPNVSYKLENNIIVIDPGHASKADLGKEPSAPNSSKLKYKQTGGADGVVTKTPEYKINMQVAKKLKSKLEEKGYTVIMTKTDNNKTMSNVERAKVGNEANAGLVIRIHADSADNSSAKGASMLVPGKNEYTKKIYDESKLFGKVILNTLTNEVGMRNRGVIERDDITGFNWSTVPVVLVEMGFLSNRNEDKLLSSNDYQEKIADALAKGIDTLRK
ncbi:N-acetylmuramoyl-L-alanine amidase family protein [Clostridium sp. ZS2-4]|uniref:N-acetylmuramoyl-L-alanine amidase family protein n=1 Tax=Clostridium sp. ZS2-4 TaxID=2987703 RepID=UPI00227B0B6E|nr:N-acetylmuramoyl-L-alanine amidase [Clostridium sp. ZS2-4]MCY6355977.1 N-acetylmuramoyl-L-alanine amidase [Clostridium sp. ZS2-4]